ncbi:cilia- and flagella-associated protein 251-like isoform X2 [Littorina saxatilis]|uniref:cilia- and flagella-associated protein 251-like isoform X2 n=1 Tax=Littorina saxatilis TaxID=31220 RepID=UPI0038B4FBEB
MADQEEPVAEGVGEVADDTEQEKSGEGDTTTVEGTTPGDETNPADETAATEESTAEETEETTTAGETTADDGTAGETTAGETPAEATAREAEQKESREPEADISQPVMQESDERQQEQYEAAVLEATACRTTPPAKDRPSSAVSRDSQGRAYLSETGRTSARSAMGEMKEGRVPTAPHLPSPERTGTTLEGTMSNSALNIVWSYGLNRNVPVLNLTDGFRKAIMYACSHVGVMYDFVNNKQFILQGHLNPITCSCISDDKRWLVTGEKGRDAMVNVWDTYTGVPIQTLFDPNPEGGVTAVALTPDARYLATLSAGPVQIMAIWDWTIDGEMPICSAELQPSYGVQDYIQFYSEDIHHVLTNSDTQVLFFTWAERSMKFYDPPLTDEDFNKPVGRFSMSIYQTNSSRALTATSIGNLVVWDNNKPLTKVVSTEQFADKKALKIIKVQDRGISVLTTTDRYIVIGDQAGHVKFFDQSLKLIYWYQDIHFGPITSVSFATDPDFLTVMRVNTEYPLDASIPAPKFVIRDFVVGTSIAIIGNVTTNGSKVQVIQREHDAAIHALASHPRLPLIAIGSYSGLLKVWNYQKKEVMVSRVFDRGSFPQTCVYDPKGAYLVVGFTNGSVCVLDSITLQDEIKEPFHFARDAITQIVFSHDSRFFATADAEYTTSLFKAQSLKEGAPFFYMGRYRAHYKPIRDLLFGVQLDSNRPRLLSLGADRVMVEYDLEKTEKDHIVVASSDRIEQSAVPCCMAWYPAVTKEHFIVTANNQFKLKLYNATTKMCRKTLLGPTYGSPVQKLAIVPTKGQSGNCYGAYMTEDKVGLIIMPLDGNPHNAMALVAHPSGVAAMSISHDGRYIFTAGGTDATVHMWEVNSIALEAQTRLGGADLIPFYGLMEGGREGELFAELEDFFYYAQIRSQGVNATDDRGVSTTIPLSEVPFVMRALGFYPTEQEIEDMVNEVKFSQYVQTGQYMEELDLGTFIRLYVNHRPAFGLSPEKLQWAFDTLGVPSPAGGAIDRGELLDMLQSKGEHMTEYELAEYLTTLLGFNPEGGSSEMHDLDTAVAGDVIDQNLPHNINATMFARQILGFALFSDSPQALE